MRLHSTCFVTCLRLGILTVQGSSGFFPFSLGQRSHTFGGAVAILSTAPRGLLHGTVSGVSIGTWNEDGLTYRQGRPLFSSLFLTSTEDCRKVWVTSGGLMVPKNTGTVSGMLVCCLTFTREPICTCDDAISLCKSPPDG